MLDIYGPSEFGTEITHKDHKMLHDAFVVVAKNNSDKRLSFYLYEDFPYTYRFNAESKTELEHFLETSDNLSLVATPIEISNFALREKIVAIKSYKSQMLAFSELGTPIAKLAESFTRNRCNSIPLTLNTCEMVYRIETK